MILQSIKVKKQLLLSSILLLLTSTFIFSIPSLALAQTELQFSEPENLSNPIESVALYDSTYGIEDGKNVMYTTVTGNPAIFQVVDLDNEEILRTFELEESESSWTHITTPNGNVYIGGNGILYEYSPETKEVRNLGGIGESVIYGLSYDEEGRVYFGSYPNAKAGMYDPATDTMKDYGSVASDQDYTRSTAYLDGFLYLGVGIDGYIVKLDVETGEHEKIDLPAEAVDGSTNIWQLDAADKYIVAGIGGGNNALLFYDTELEAWSETFYTDNKGLRLVQGKPGEDQAYFLQNNKLQEIDLKTLEIRDTEIVFGTFLRNTSWVEVEGDEDLPGLSLATIQFAGQVTFMNLETKKVKTTQYPLVGNPIPIQTLEKGPDGNLYVSGYPGGKASVYDPKKDETRIFNLGQAEGMTFLNGKVYFGVYPTAVIHEMDLEDAFKEEVEPEQIGQISDQDRPFIMKPIDEKIYIGTIPDYGDLGGSLTIYDPETKNLQEHKNVIDNQSIVGLVEKDGIVYGSTTVDGGLGVTPIETEAKIFTWDIDKGEKIREFVPDIPDVSIQPKRISGLTIGPDGLLWGATDGTIFAMDTENFEVVKHKNIYPEVKDKGRWRPVHIRWGDDGHMYTTLAGKITVIDPESLDSYTLEDTELMTLGDDGAIYYASGTNIKKIEVTATEVISTIEKVEGISNIVVKYGTSLDDISLPEEVEVSFSEGETEDVAVLWDEGEPVYDAEKAGTYALTGTLELSSFDEGVNPNNLLASLTIEVEEEEEKPEKDEEKASDEKESPSTPSEDETYDEEEEIEIGVENDVVDGEKLPKTATNHYNLLIGGSILLFMAVGIYFYRKKA